MYHKHLNFTFFSIKHLGFVKIPKLGTWHHFPFIFVMDCVKCGHILPLSCPLAHDMDMYRACVAQNQSPFTPPFSLFQPDRTTPQAASNFFNSELNLFLGLEQIKMYEPQNWLQIYPTIQVLQRPKVIIANTPPKITSHS